jgi:hypothetical protein
MATTIDLRGILKPNVGTPKFASDYKDGDRPTGAVLLSRLDLSSGTVPNGSGLNSWGFGALSGAAITVANDGTHNYLRGQYPIDISGDQSGDNYIYGGYTPSTLQQELFVTIYAKTPNSSLMRGCKFCKIFGAVTNGGSDYSNTTLGTIYETGDLEYAAYGDGTTPQNDTQNGLAYYTPNYIDVGRAGSLTRTFERGGAFLASSWGTGWNKFQFRVKLNSGTTSGNEVNDGVVEVYVNGVMKGRAINIFNRHYSNSFFETINFFGYSKGATLPWELHMRDITVSTGGWID